mmetsp:Transcript_95378/g.269953  ORF Transcript_95378/g.269953 Transcript_95378/m.269953 type:complete len:312 (-) Transcript_95378:393-1328(-)
MPSELAHYALTSRIPRNFSIFPVGWGRTLQLCLEFLTESLENCIAAICLGLDAVLFRLLGPAAEVVEDAAVELGVYLVAVVLVCSLFCITQCANSLAGSFALSALLPLATLLEPGDARLLVLLACGSTLAPSCGLARPHAVLQLKELHLGLQGGFPRSFALVHAEPGLPDLEQPDLEDLRHRGHPHKANMLTLAVLHPQVRALGERARVKVPELPPFMLAPGRAEVLHHPVHGLYHLHVYRQRHILLDCHHKHFLVDGKRVLVKHEDGPEAPLGLFTSPTFLWPHMVPHLLAKPSHRFTTCMCLHHAGALL